jgi:hypothetical protein
MASDRYMQELDYLYEYVNDCLRELSFLIHDAGACDEFHPRVSDKSVNCRHCAYTWVEHD